MKTKYEDLIEQLVRVTSAYNAALSSVINLEEMVSEQSDVIGISGGVTWYGDKFEKERAIQLGADTFTPFAIDCGSGFKMKDRYDYTRFECSMFGYRVFSLLSGDESGYAELLDKVKAGE